jgi:uncharacterized protein (TIGR03067 family)
MPTSKVLILRRIAIYVVVFGIGAAILWWWTREDETRLQGTWVATEWWGNFVLPGLRLDDEEGVTFKRTDFVFFVRNPKNSRTLKGTFRLNPYTVPRQIDFVMPGRTILGIYEINWNLLRIALEEKPGERPKHFDYNFIRFKKKWEEND